MEICFQTTLFLEEILEKKIKPYALRLSKKIFQKLKY